MAIDHVYRVAVVRSSKAPEVSLQPRSRFRIFQSSGSLWITAQLACHEMVDLACMHSGGKIH